MIDTVARLFPSPERRTAEQVRLDIASEFDHHLACMRDDLRAAGTPEHEIEARVTGRFGDRRAYIARCTRIALRERIMLQRINLVLLVIVGLAIIWTARGTGQAAEQNALALENLAKRIDELAGARTPASESPAAAVSEPTAGYVVIRGDNVKRPGLFSLPSDASFTLRRLLVAAEFTSRFGSTTARIRVHRLQGDGTKNAEVFTLDQIQYEQADGPDFVLKPGDLVQTP